MTVEYLRFELLKSSVGFETDDTSYDNKLQEITMEANQELDLQLKPFAEDTPLEAGSQQFVQAQNAALHYAKALWFTHIRQYEIEERESKRYEERIEALKASFDADRNSRTGSIIVSRDPRDEDIIMPSQTDSLVFLGY